MSYPDFSSHTLPACSTSDSDSFIRTDTASPLHNSRSICEEFLMGCPAPPDSTELHLYCTAGQYKGQSFRFEHNFSIGRHSSNDIRLTSCHISRHHCRFIHKNLEWSVQCLGLNGIIFDGKHFAAGDTARCPIWTHTAHLKIIGEEFDVTFIYH